MLNSDSINYAFNKYVAPYLPTEMNTPTHIVWIILAVLMAIAMGYIYGATTGDINLAKQEQNYIRSEITQIRIDIKEILDKINNGGDRR